MSSAHYRALMRPLLISAAMLVVPQAATAQGTYPAKAVNFIVPFAAGGNGDIVSRMVAQRLSSAMGQPILVDNRPGAGGNIGAQAAARAAPDGYTWVLASGPHATNMTLYKDPGYDLVRDFAPAAMLSTSPFVLAIHPSVKATTLKEFIAVAKASPGKLNFGSPGVGAGGHMSGELLKSMAGIDITHVPYKGAAQAITDLVAGEVQAVFNAASTAMPLVSTGKVRALGVSSRRPSPLAPGIPAIADVGVPGFESTVWQGISVPARTPAAVPTRINREVNVLLANTEFKEQLFKQGVDPEPMTPEAFGSYVKTEVEKWARVIKQLGITAD